MATAEAEIKSITGHAQCGWQVDGAGDPQNAYCREQCPLGMTCTWQRTVLLWPLDPARRVSEQIADANAYYVGEVGSDAVLAMMTRMPTGAESGALVGEVMVIPADWVPDGYAALWSTALERR